MELSKRLQTIASFVEQGKTVADIGTDHGYIPIYLAKKGISPKVIAMDINKDPLMKAKNNALAYQADDVIEFRLSNGLESLLPGEIDTIIIAGMGGKLIEEILEKGKDKLSSLYSLVLSPHKDVDAVRQILYKYKMPITDEEMVFEDGHYYNIIVAHKKEDEKDSSDDLSIAKNAYNQKLEMKYGKMLIKKKHPLLYKQLEEQIEKNNELIRLLEERNIVHRKEEIVELIDEEKQVIKWLQ